MERENFERYSCLELFYFLLDHLVIPPESEFKHFRDCKPTLVYMAEEFEKEHNNFTTLYGKNII